MSPLEPSTLPRLSGSVDCKIHDLTRPGKLARFQVIGKISLLVRGVLHPIRQLLVTTRI